MGDCGALLAPDLRRLWFLLLLIVDLLELEAVELRRELPQAGWRVCRTVP